MSSGRATPSINGVPSNAARLLTANPEKKELVAAAKENPAVQATGADRMSAEREPFQRTADGLSAASHTGRDHNRTAGSAGTPIHAGSWAHARLPGISRLPEDNLYQRQ